MNFENKDWIERYDGLFAKNVPHSLNNPLLDKDIWNTKEDLKLKINEHRRLLTLDFTVFKEDWFNFLVKLYILKISQPNKPATTIVGKLSWLKKFNIFLMENGVDNPKKINNQVMESFILWIKDQNLSQNSAYSIFSVVRIFLDTCRREGWFDFETYYLQNNPFSTNYISTKIDYLPEEIWNQLNDNLHRFPEPLQRMVLIIRALGLRAGEILTLPFDCLRKRGNKWNLRLTTEKIDIEDELFIVPDLVAIIKEQQRYIREHLGENYNYLFCSSKRLIGWTSASLEEKKELFRIFIPVPKVMGLHLFNKRLNQFADLFQIKSSSGEIWRFRSHQFRKTVGTVLTNTGVRDLIIQKYLRHRSIDMQNYYKHLLEKVIGDEYEELMKEKQYIDNTGKIVATHKPTNVVNELIRRKRHQITTQYGECHRPIIKSPCQKINACWSCEHWRTSLDDLDLLKNDLNRVEEEKQIAEKLGMIRQKQGLEDNFNSLKKRIDTLERIHDTN